jgi:hypothetical protein
MFGMGQKKISGRDDELRNNIIISNRIKPPPEKWLLLEAASPGPNHPIIATI